MKQEKNVGNWFSHNAFPALPGVNKLLNKHVGIEVELNLEFQGRKRLTLIVWPYWSYHLEWLRG